MARTSVEQSPPLPRTSLTLDPKALARLLPMHVAIDQAGNIKSAGPTIQKLGFSAEIVGGQFFDLFDVMRPRQVSQAADLVKGAGTKVKLGLAHAKDLVLAGSIVATENDATILMNLSFGYSLLSAVQKFDLTCGDFAATDLALEFLFVLEANSAAQIEQKRLNERLNSAKIAAEAQAMTDDLTGLANRRSLDTALAGNLSRGADFSLLQIDLDYFKAVNDTLGHAAGDVVLQSVAEVLQRLTRTSDHIARIGGDEFMLILNRLTDPSDLMNLANRIIQGLEEPIPFEGDTCLISGSIGIAVSRRETPSNVERMMREVDTALYSSKYSGRARATIYEPGLEKFVETRAQEAAERT
ncbi:MAG: GGDEF domain-containing protein, partial [Pseudomonadota bacterium]